MPTFNSDDLTKQEAYKLLTSAVIPRPIAWVSTLSDDGVPNLAPFSFFNVVSPTPPTLIFSVTQREGKFAYKDTYTNLMNRRECVVNIVTLELAEAMNLSATELPADIDEFAHSNVTAIPSLNVAPFRVAESPIQFECKLQQVVTLSNEHGTSQVMFCEIIVMHISDAVYMGNHKIDPALIHAIGRMAGGGYSTTEDRFELERPPSQLGQ